jgi:hypothetical protein
MSYGSHFKNAKYDWGFETVRPCLWLGKSALAMLTLCHRFLRRAATIKYIPGPGKLAVSLRECRRLSSCTLLAVKGSVVSCPLAEGCRVPHTPA